MKKLLFLSLLLVPLFVTSIFAANGVGVLNQLPPTAKLETQIRVLTVMDHLQITTSQASALAQAMIELKKDVNSLQQQRLTALTALRDALLSSNKDAIANAHKKLESVSKSYFKAIGKFKDSVESIVTLKQAMMAREWFKASMERPGPLGELLKAFIARRNEALRQKGISKPSSPAFKSQKPPMKPEQMKPGQKQGQMRPGQQRPEETFRRPTRAPLMEEMSRREGILYFIVNSELYNTIVKTLQMKAAATK
jgi:hypothetical protein